MKFLDIIFILDGLVEGVVAILNLKNDNHFFFNENGKAPSDVRVILAGSLFSFGILTLGVTGLFMFFASN
jgi:hypothetical protein